MAKLTPCTPTSDAIWVSGSAGLKA
jgi:hypothetical protein